MISLPISLSRTAQDSHDFSSLQLFGFGDFFSRYQKPAVLDSFRGPLQAFAVWLRQVQFDPIYNITAKKLVTQLFKN